MAEKLCSVGVDVGTTTTQLIVSELTVENQASAFAVPKMEITQRKIRYRSPVHFTPLVSDQLVDGEKLRQLLQREYALAGITPEQVDTGAVIITGETSRKENASRVLQALSKHAGDFVVATAGPDLESSLAARGSGAVSFSAQTGKRVLHMDIGGGTSNLALIEDGKILRTGCMNVGGRLVKVDGNGIITYLSPVARQLTELRVGEKADLQKLEKLADSLAQGLEMAAGLREKTEVWDLLVTQEAPQTQPVAPGAVISFSGGVADCIESEHGANSGPCHPQKPVVSGGIPLGGADYPRHGDRCRVPQRHAIRQHGVLSKCGTAAEKSTGGDAGSSAADGWGGHPPCLEECGR